jgi:hypothetical protein
LFTSPPGLAVQAHIRLPDIWKKSRSDGFVEFLPVIKVWKCIYLKYCICVRLYFFISVISNTDFILLQEVIEILNCI